MSKDELPESFPDGRAGPGAGAWRLGVSGPMTVSLRAGWATDPTEGWGGWWPAGGWSVRSPKLEPTASPTDPWQPNHVTLHVSPAEVKRSLA